MKQNNEQLPPGQGENQQDKDWHPYDKGRTLGKTGSEEGRIIRDLENVNGARITVEQVGDPLAPGPHYAITFGIYGLLFHTHFKTEEEQVEQTIAWLQDRMEKIFLMYELPERRRDNEWFNEHDRLVHELTID